MGLVALQTLLCGTTGECGASLGHHREVEPKRPAPCGDRTRTLPDDEAAVGRKYATPEQGQRVGRYEIRSQLGAGGMGTVYLARDPQLQRDVAVKLIRPERAGSEQARARFVREARAMAKIVHANVVEVYDAGIAEGRPYVVMELVRGTTLDAWLAERPREPEQIRHHVYAAGRGLVAAHDAGLIHRDFKPANVLIGDDGRVRVSDFGLARALEESKREPSEDFETTQPEDLVSLTRTGAILGSPVYMAPEQHQGEPELVDARADQFAFAVTMFEAVVGRRPYDSTSTLALLHAKIEGPPDVPADTAWLRAHGSALQRALHPDPHARWPSVKILLDVLLTRRSTRRTVVYAGAAAGIGLLSWALVPQATQRCQLGEARASEVWNAEHREAVTTALAATGRAHAQETTAHALAELDARAAAWIEVYAEACESPERDLDKRMTCVESHRSRLAETIAKLEQADGATADRAIAIAAGSTTAAKCLEPATDSFAKLSEEQRAVAEDIRVQLRHAKEDEHLGRTEAAEAATAVQLARARQVGDQWLIAFALNTRASALESLARYDEAMELLTESSKIAETAGEWKQAAASQIEAVFIEGYRRGNSDEALRLARQAEAALTRSSHSPQLEAALHSNIGATYHAMGRTDAACASMAAALEIREENPTAFRSAISHRVAMATSRENVGSCMVMAGRYSEALPYLAAALEESKSVFGANNPEVASVHQALSAALESSGRNSEAIEEIDRSITLWSASLPANDPRLASAHADRGYALSSGGRLPEAIDALLLAADIMEKAKGSDHPRPWSYRANAAEAMVVLGRLDEATKVSRDALSRLLGSVPAPDRSRIVAYTAAGRVALAQQDGETALAHFSNALGECKQLWGPDAPQSLSLHIDVAKSWQAVDNPAEAKAELERAVALAAIEPQREPIHTGEAYFELAKMVYSEDATRARQLAERATEIYGTHAEMPDRVEEVEAWMAAP